MKAKSSNLLLLTALLVTVIALIAHDYLPKKRWQVLPDEHAWYALYADGDEGGPSQSEWIDGEPLQWRCRIENRDKFVFCGVNFLISVNNRDGVDVSGFDEVHLKLNPLSKPRNLRFFMRHYDERYSNPDDGNSPKFINFNIRAKDLGQELKIGLNEFTVADWWLAQKDLPREWARPEFGNIIALGLDYREILPAGNHDIEIEKLEFVGDWVSAELWYLSILVLWLGGIFLFVILRFFNLRRAAQRDKQRLDALYSKHSELKQETEKYKDLSLHDQLTGLLNRYGFDQAVQKLYSDNEATSTSLVLMDIDHFKRINDQLGHNTGDQVISRFADIVYQHTRDRDALCRWGGEEFLLLCPYTSADKALALAEKIRQIVFETDFGTDQPLAVTASFGVCQITPKEDFIAAFARADRALYEAKHSGRNCVVLAQD